MAVPAESTPPALALEFKDFRTFLNAFAANVCRGGMFLEAPEPQPPGSEIEFELALEGGDALLRGRVEVAWVTGDDGSEPAGMGVRFLELDPGGAKLIERIEEIRTKSGREIFDIERGTRPAPQSADSDPTIDLLRAELESLKEAQVEERARLVADLDTVRLERDRLVQQLHAFEASDAADERDRLLSELEAMRAELQSARADTAQLEQRVEDQDADLARFAEQGKYAMIERDRLEAGRTKLAEELEVARAEVERLEIESRESSESAARLEQADNDLAEAAASEAALREQLAEAHSHAERVEQEARLTESQLRSELEELLASRNELRSGLETGQAELDEVRRQFEESAGKNLELEHELGSMATQLAEAGGRLDKLASESATTTAEIERLRTRHDEMEAELLAERKAAERARKVSQRVRAEHVRLQEELAEAQATLEETRQSPAPTAAGAGEVDTTLESMIPDASVLGEVDGQPDTVTPDALPDGASVTLEEAASERVEGGLAIDPEDGEPQPATPDQAVYPWEEQSSGKAKRSSLWAAISNKLRGEAEAAEPEGEESSADGSEEATAAQDSRPEAATEEGEAVVGR